MSVAVVEPGDPQCLALNLSDGERCQAQATAYANRFCKFHAAQCYGLYKGYKRRNRALDALACSAPAFLTAQGVGSPSLNTPVANVSFKTIKDPAELQSLHAHLFAQYALLGKVIAARKLHHTHFFSVDLDYGHQKYLELLQARRFGVLRALENVEKRSAAVLYEREKWFKWVRTSQADEEATRDKEQKKVKAEAAMFSRHWKEVQVRMKAHRAKEEGKKQDAFLEQVWKERMEESSYESEAGGEDWDPIDDVLEEEREKYLDLIRQFLWMETEKDEQATVQDEAQAESAPEEVLPIVEAPVVQAAPASPPTVEEEVEDVESVDPAATSKGKKKSKSKNKKKVNKSHKATDDTVSPASTPASKKSATIPDKEHQVGKGHIESPDEIRSRLKEGAKRDHSGLAGPQLVGTIQKPLETYHKLAPVPADEIEQILNDIADIKTLLFCRTLLGHATLLPAALRAASVDAFLADPDVSDSDLRDLCLKVESPNLQALRDACADFARGDDPEPPPPEDELEILSAAEVMRRNLMYGDLDEMHLFTSLTSNKILRDLLKDGLAAADKKPAAGKQAKSQRIKITVCGRTIWNHASEHAMARDGWLQFSIMAKDCTFNEAVGLCRNWDEFYELQTLTLWSFFPSAKWASWAQNAVHEQLLQLGFITFHLQTDAEKQTMHNQVGSRGHQRRQHHMEECRNIICGHMKRGDPVTNRFIDYCLMQGGSLHILVRDRLTGQTVTAPRKDERWIYRVKSGLGRASKKEWETKQQLGRRFFRHVDEQRDWHFGFDSCYDVYVYDFLPGQSPMELLHRLVDTFIRALRITGPSDTCNHQRHILENLVQEPDTKRVRQIRPGETNIYDEMHGPNARFSMVSTDGHEGDVSSATSKDDGEGNSPYMWWNDSDAAEADVLFSGNRDQGLFTAIKNPIALIENLGPATLLAHQAERIESLLADEDDDEDDEDYFSGALARQKSIFSQGKEVEGAEQFIYRVPPIWREAYYLIKLSLGKHGQERERMLDRLDYTSTELELEDDDLRNLDRLELMERDRSFGFKDSFHLADLEPGAREKYVESTKIIMGAQNYTGTLHTEWAWSCLGILDSLGLQAWYDEYVQEPVEPWPHRYLAQDMTQAFVMMGLFFPNLDTTKIVQSFLESESGRQFKNSKLLDQAGRARDIPDRRGRDSGLERPRSFYKEVKRLNEEEEWGDDYPMEWNMAVKPVLAKLYRAGIIKPSDTPPWVPEACTGLTFAAEEPHRPGKLDMFICFDAPGMMSFPPNYIPKKDWPELLPPASAFALAHPKARFAVLRLWSACHFYPLMIGAWNRPNFTFIDAQSRSWEWKFMPKDMNASEWSVHTTTMTRLELVFARAEKHGTHSKDKRMKNLRGKVVYRGDAVLVMGEDEEDLFRSVTAVSFALQTKPWLREIDLWKSFVNVDAGFLQRLDPVWLD